MFFKIRYYNRRNKKRLSIVFGDSSWDAVDFFFKSKPEKKRSRIFVEKVSALNISDDTIGLGYLPEREV